MARPPTPLTERLAAEPRIQPGAHEQAGLALRWGADELHVEVGEGLADDALARPQPREMTLRAGDVVAVQLSRSTRLHATRGDTFRRQHHLHVELRTRIDGQRLRLTAPIADEALVAGVPVLERPGATVPLGVALDVLAAARHLGASVTRFCATVDVDADAASVADVEDLLFSDGRAPVRVDGRYGFVDEGGRIAVAPRYDDVHPFSEGRAAVCVDGRWGFVDPNGAVVVEPAFVDALPFRGGAAQVRDEQGWGRVDRSGRAAGALPIAPGLRAGGLVASASALFFFTFVLLLMLLGFTLTGMHPIVLFTVVTLVAASGYGSWHLLRRARSHVGLPPLWYVLGHFASGLLTLALSVFLLLMIAFMIGRGTDPPLVYVPLGGALLISALATFVLLRDGVRHLRKRRRARTDE